MPKSDKFDIPDLVKQIASVLYGAGFEAYLVGGCVRDLLLGRAPKDWDVATNAKPAEVQKLFSSFAKATADKPATVYENEFGTVGVKTESEDPALKIIEVTTYRSEGKYTDKRHPDEIKFAEKVEEDLARRDFTVNAIALNINSKHARLASTASRGWEARSSKTVSDFGFRISDFALVDPYGGEEDLKKKIIRAVGDPEARFNEDALRLLRAVRFATELGFKIHPDTQRAIEKHAGLLSMIAKERIRDEFMKMIMAETAAGGVRLLESSGLLAHVLPELREGIGVEQNLHHIYTVFEHSLQSLAYAESKNYPLEIRLAALLHDEATVKRFIDIRGRKYLKPENPKYENIYPQDEWTVQGKVVGVIRQLE